MKLFISILFGIILLSVNVVIAEEKSEVTDYVSQCKKDLEFFRSSVKKNSSVYTNKSDTIFQAWFKKGHEDTLKLIDAIGDKDDCYYAMKYYIILMVLINLILVLGGISLCQQRNIQVS